MLPTTCCIKVSTDTTILLPFELNLDPELWSGPTQIKAVENLNAPLVSYDFHVRQGKRIA
jgi:hypothetical protein